MNVITRGMRSALRNPIRSGGIVVMLAISIGLILAMLVARSSVDAKISEVKATTATQLTINPAGVQGVMGGGDPLTAEQVKTITETEHIASISSDLMAQLESTDTNLKSSLEGGKLRIMRGGPSGQTFDSSADSNAPAPTPPITMTGTSNPSATITSDKLTSGSMVNGNSSDLTALVGKKLAEKNNLSVGDTFTAYGKTITVKGIYDAESMFENSGITMSLASVQTLTEQAGAVSRVNATVDSSDNVASTVTALKKQLGDKADVISQQEQAEESLAPLASIANLALAGVIGATIAGAVIVLLSMIMIVRERRREIGVIKAIGGTNVKIMTQFVTEALTLTIIGGVIGLGLGIAVSGPMTQSLVSSSSDTPTSKSSASPGGGPGKVMMGGPLGRAGNQLQADLTNVTSTLTPQIFAASAGIVLLIAVIGSAVPAWAIARVRPAEVLRTE